MHISTKSYARSEPVVFSFSFASHYSLHVEETKKTLSDRIPRLSCYLLAKNLCGKKLL